MDNQTDLYTQLDGAKFDRFEAVILSNGSDFSFDVGETVILDNILSSPKTDKIFNLDNANIVKVLVEGYYTVLYSCNYIPDTTDIITLDILRNGKRGDNLIGSALMSDCYRQDKTQEITISGKMVGYFKENDEVQLYVQTSGAGGKARCDKNGIRLEIYNMSAY